MAKRYSKAAHSKRRKQTSHVLKNTVILLFCAVGIWFGSSLWHAALTLQTAQPAESIAGEEFRPQVGDPPYRVVIDAGHGGADPGARGVIEEKDMTAATASELIRLLQQDSNFIPLQTRDSFDETATPAQRAARADEQAPQLLLSIHGNSAANGSTASGFECYPAMPGRTWHQESFYFEQLLAKGMQVDLKQLQSDIEARDKQDCERKIAPLCCAEDAIFLDSSNMSIQEVASQILTLVQEH